MTINDLGNLELDYPPGHYRPPVQHPSHPPIDDRIRNCAAWCSTSLAIPVARIPPNPALPAAGRQSSHLSGSPSSSLDRLPSLDFWVNSYYHSAMGMTPKTPRLALLALAMAMALFCPVCRKPANRPPVTPEVPTGVTSGDRDTIYEFRSVAVDPDGDRVALRFAWGNGDTSDWSPWLTSGETTSMYHSWDSAGTYQITSQAKDDSESLSGWSAPGEMTIAPLAPGTLKWRYKTGSIIGSAPVVGRDGTVYVGSRDCYFYAIDRDGKLKWRYQTGGWVEGSPAIGADGTVYFGAYDSSLYALNQDGTLRWSYHTGHLVYSSPAIGTDGTIFVGSYDDYLYALNSDGTLKWRYQSGDHVLSSPAVASDGTVYFGSWDKCLYSLNSDGGLRWRYATEYRVFASPAIAADGTIYVGSEDYGLYALNPDGTLMWRYETRSSVHSSPTIGSDGTVYFGSEDSSFYALNPNGTLKWCYQSGAWIRSTPAVSSDGTVYFGIWFGRLCALNPDGTLGWKYEASNFSYSSPAIGPDGTVYIGSDDGYVYAIQGSAPLADSPWPKFHHDNCNSGRVGGP